MKPYLLAVGATAAATVLTGALWPANKSAIAALYYPAVFVTAIYGNRLAASLAIGLSALSTCLFFSLMHGSVPATELAYVLTIFCIVSSLVVILIQPMKANEVKLRDSDELLRTAFHSNPVGMAISRMSDGRYVEMNSTFGVLIGRSREQTIGNSATELGLVSAEDRADHLAELSRTGSFRDRAFAVPQRGGGTRQVLVSSERIEFRGEPHFIGIFHDITERTRAEETLREQAELLDNAQRIGRMGSWNLDLRTGRLAWPDATCRLFGIAPSEFTGTFEQFHSLILPEDVADYDAANARVTLSNPVFEAEYRIRRPDGAVRWMHSRGHLDIDEAGAPIGRVGVVMDMTDQHVAGERLAETVALLRIAGRVAHLGGWTIQLPSRELTWSDETCVIHNLPAGYKPSLDEGLGYYPAEYRAEVLRCMETCERDGTGYDLEVPKMTATGRRIWVRSIGEAVRDANGRIVGLQGAFQDISTRRHAEHEARQKDTLIRIAGRLTHTGGWAIELPGDRVFWSDEVFEILGYARGAMPPLAVALALYPHPWRDKIVAAIQACRQDGMPFDLETEILTAQGARKWVHVSGEGERDADGSITRVQGAFQDITERRQLEQQYLRAQRMESIGTLAGGIAHDLNNVLAPILLSIGLLSQDEHDADRLAILATIEASAKRGAAMVGRVLSFARGAEGLREEVQVPLLIRDLATIVRDTFPKNITFEDHIGPELWSLQADATQLHQVLLNLCVNARDAMPAGGQITLIAKNIVIDKAWAARYVDARSGPYVTIAVEDTGSGISKEIIDKIFDPFFTTKEIGKGTGLGLATSMAIITGHGGFMHVHSDPGTRTRFDVYLPAQTTPATTAAPPPVVIHPRGKGETVLVVDDEEGIRRIAKRTLEAFGYRVLLASDGARAVALYARHQADIAVVLTDMMMPLMDGTATIQELVRLNPQVCIVGASGLAIDAKAAGLAAGRVIQFLRKPYTAETLLRSIREALPPVPSKQSEN